MRSKRAAAAASPEATYARVVAAFAGSRDVEAPSPTGGRFGANALKVRGKIFAMLVRGEFVVKLPRDRLDALVASRAGRHFTTGNRVMRAWFVAAGVDEGRWRALADEAYAAAREGSRR